MVYSCDNTLETWFFVVYTLSIMRIIALMTMLCFFVNGCATAALWETEAGSVQYKPATISLDKIYKSADKTPPEYCLRISDFEVKQCLLISALFSQDHMLLDAIFGDRADIDISTLEVILGSDEDIKMMRINAYLGEYNISNSSESIQVNISGNSEEELFKEFTVISADGKSYIELGSFPYDRNSFLQNKYTVFQDNHYPIVFHSKKLNREYKNSTGERVVGTPFALAADALIIVGAAYVVVIGVFLMLLTRGELAGLGDL